MVSVSTDGAINCSYFNYHVLSGLINSYGSKGEVTTTVAVASGSTKIAASRSTAAT